MIGLIVASAPALKPRYESFMRRFIDMTQFSASRRQYGTANSASIAFGTLRKTVGDPENDDENDLKMDYYHKSLGGANHKTEVGQGFARCSSSEASDELALQGSSTDQLKTDQFRVTQTVMVADSR